MGTCQLWRIRQVLRVALFAYVSLLLSVPALGAEFSFVELRKGRLHVDDFFDKLGIPDINDYIDCPRRIDECWKYIVNHRGQVIDGPYYLKTNRVTILGKARYRDKALALVKRVYSAGREYYSELYLLYHNGYKRSFEVSLPEGVVEVKPLPRGSVLMVTKTHLHEISPLRILFSIPLPMEVEYAYIGNDPFGKVSVIAVGRNDVLFISYNRKATRFLIDPNALTTRGDREGILSIYPDSRDVSYAAVYRYANPYNKGIVLYEVNFRRGTIRKGFLFNSEERNVGFDPSVFSTKKEVVVSAKNSTENTYVHFVVPRSRIKDLGKTSPEHIRGFEGDKYAEFMLSARLTLLTWNALSQVKKYGTTYATARYRFSNSLFYGYSLEGRLGDTQIAIVYMQNRAEEMGGLTADISEFISATVDIHGLVGKRNILRIGYERARVNGIAEFSSTTGGALTLFETDLNSYYGYLMGERGRYIGLEFLNYRISSAVGFSDDWGSIVLVGFDPNFTLNSLLLVLGYDHVSYARRYETNFEGFYFAGNGGLGLGIAEVSPYLKEQARVIAGADEVQIPLYIVLKAYGEVGYLYQRRVKDLRGLGFSLNLGYRLSFMFAGAGSEGGSSNVSRVYLEFSRLDLLHGPFLQANLIF